MTEIWFSFGAACLHNAAPGLALSAAADPAARSPAAFGADVAGLGAGLRHAEKAKAVG